MRTGQGKTWTAHRVSSLRTVHGIHAYRSAEKDGEWLTMTEAAAKLLGVTNHVIRRLIKDGILAAEQVVPGAPYQIRATDLQNDSVTASLARKGRPCRDEFRQIRCQCFQALENGGRNRGKSPGTAAFFSCANSSPWTLYIMCCRHPPFPR